MNAEPVAIRHSILDAVAVGEEIRARYDLGEPFHCELLARGMNDVYLVRGGDTRLAARVWRTNGVERDSVGYELAFLRHLDEAGIPVAPPVAMRDGGLQFAVRAPEGERAVALFRWVEGDVLHHHPDPVPLAREVGTLFAQVHLKGLEFRHAPTRLTDYAGHIRRGLPDLERLAAGRDEDIAFYRRACEAVAAALDSLDRTALPWGPSHGDLHAHNVLVGKNGGLTIMDFESCGEDFFALDLVSLVWAGRKNGFPDAAIQAFLDAYDSVRPRTAEERRLEPLFLAAKELRYFTGFAGLVNQVGHLTFRYPGLDWFAKSVRRHVREAGLL